MKKTVIVDFIKYIMWCLVIVSLGVMPLLAETTYLKKDLLVFSRGGGFGDSGTDIYTVNNKGVKIEDSAGALGNLLIRDPEKKYTAVTISDAVTLPQPDGIADVTTFNVVVGDYYGQYLRMNHAVIEAMVSENNVVSQSELKIQDNIGEVWMGTLLESETSSGVWNNPTVKIMPTLQGTSIVSYVGIGNVPEPQSAVHVGGDLRIDNGALIGAIGIGEYLLGSAGVQSSSGWLTVRSKEFSALPVVNHGAVIVGVITLTSRAGGITVPKMRLRLVRIEDDGSETQVAISAENQGRFESGWSDDGTFSTTLGVEDLEPDTRYKAQIQINDARTVSNRSASITALFIPTDTIDESDLEFPEIDRIDKQDPNITSAESEAGNYITQDKVAFESGGRIQNAGSNVFIVNKEGEYYPFKAGEVEAAEIHEASVLRYVKTDSTELYDFIIQEPGDTSELLKFGLLWNSSNDEMAYVTSNIQRVINDDHALTFKGSTIYLSDGAMTLDTSITVNKPKLVPEEPDVALDIQGNLMIEGTTLGGAFYVNSAQELAYSDYYSSGSNHTVYSPSFTIPEGNNYRLFVYASLSIQDSFSSSGTQTMDVWLEGTDASSEAETKSSHTYESVASWGVDNRIGNYTLQSVVDVYGGETRQILIKAYAPRRSFRTLGMDMIVVGLPQ